MEKDIKPKDIMTRPAFENAMVIIMALGGSTNAVLHLLAMARAADVELTIEDFQACSILRPGASAWRTGFDGIVPLNDVSHVRVGKGNVKRMAGCDWMIARQCSHLGWFLHAGVHDTCLDSLIHTVALIYVQESSVRNSG